MTAIDPRLTDIHNSLYRVALKAVIVIDGKLLITEERSGLHNLPGGGLDYDEEVDAALLRELKEEVGVEAQDVHVEPGILAITHKGVLRGIPRLQVYYRATITSPKALKGGELGYKWVTADELKALQLSPVIQADRELLLAQFH